MNDHSEKFGKDPKKVIVQKTEDYYCISPIKPTKPNQSNSECSVTQFPTADVCVIGETTIRRIPCDACRNNGPSTSTHFCQTTRRLEGSNFKSPNVLRKNKASKASTKKKCENVTVNLSLQLGEIQISQAKSSVDAPKRKYRKSTGKTTQKDKIDKKPTSIPESIDETFSGTFFQDCLKPVDNNLSYNESVNEAIVMDLLDKKYGNILESELSMEMEKKDVNDNSLLALNLKDECIEIKDEGLSENYMISNFEIEPAAKREQSETDLETMKAIETILILDSPDKNYGLFSRHELKTLPEKIFESPLRPVIKQEESSPVKEHPDVSYTPDDTLKQSPTEIFDIRSDISETSEKTLTQEKENSLEVFSEPPSNIFGDETYQQLFTSVVGNECFSVIARDIEVVTSENTDPEKHNICRDTKNSTGGMGKKIWEIRSEDISFDVLKEPSSPRPEQPKQDGQAENLSNGFHGFSNISSDDIDRNEKCLGNLLEIIARDSFTKATVEDDTNELVSSNTTENSSEAASDLVPEVVIAKPKETMTDSSVSGSISHDLEECVGNTDSGSSTSTETLVEQDNSVETTIIALENLDLTKSITEADENVNKFLLDIISKNPPTLEPESPAGNSQINVEEVDILEPKDESEFVPSSDGDVEKHYEYTVKEHCYCSLANSATTVIEENHVEPNLEGTLTPNNTREECLESVENIAEVPTEDLGSDIECLDLVVKEQPVGDNQMVKEAPQLLVGELGQKVRETHVAKTDTELMDLKQRIMEGKIDKDEILEIIESKNIVQYNVNVEVPQNDVLDQQKRDAKHLSDCLKKQIDVMKKTYIYFEEIIESTSKLLEGNITEIHMKDIFDNLNFVKDIIDKTFTYYNTEKNRGNKIRFKVVSITKKNAKPQKSPVGSNPRRSKLLPKMLYRMNRLLSYLETYQKSTNKRKQSAFLNKLREMARKDYSKLQERVKSRARVVRNRREIMSFSSENANETVPTPSTSKKNKILTSIENVDESPNTVAPCKPIITPLSKDVKIILSQIEQLNSRRLYSEKNTVEEIHQKILEAKSKRISKARTKSVNLDKFVINDGEQDEVILVETASATKTNEPDVVKVMADSVVKRNTHSRRSRSKKQNQAGTGYETDDSEIGSEVPSRCSRRSRKPPDFFSSEKYLPNGQLPSKKIEIDCSKIKSKSNKSSHRNLKFEFENIGNPRVVLYDEKEKPNGSKFLKDNKKPGKDSSNKTELQNMKNVKTDSRTKRNSRKNETKSVGITMTLRSSSSKAKNPKWRV